MARSIPEGRIAAIEAAVRYLPEGASARRIADALSAGLSHRTLQHTLNRLVGLGRLERRGQGRRTSYHLPGTGRPSPAAAAPAGGAAEAGAGGQAPAGGAGTARDEEPAEGIPLSEAGADIRSALRLPASLRKPIGYSREFLESYEPGISSYLGGGLRERLAGKGALRAAAGPGGSARARHALDRLVVDLSWNSSRLEGGSLSLLDARRLLEFRADREDGDPLDRTMVLNHRDAIRMLAERREEIGFDRETVFGIHALLSDNIVRDPASVGRLRGVPVGVERSSYRPLDNPRAIGEIFGRVLGKAAAIGDPFEQAFFALVHLPYLRAFEDVNKRVSRLAANIPFVKAGLAPLSFAGVPRGLYADALLGIYEFNRIELMRDLFAWAYERSAADYVTPRERAVLCDPFRLRHREALRRVVREIVRGPMGREAAFAHIESRARQLVLMEERERFREAAEVMALELHEGAIAPYRIGREEFGLWQGAWSEGREPEGRGAVDGGRPAKAPGAAGGRPGSP